MPVQLTQYWRHVAATEQRRPRFCVGSISLNRSIPQPSRIRREVECTSTQWTNSLSKGYRTTTRDRSGISYSHMSHMGLSLWITRRYMLVWCSMQTTNRRKREDAHPVTACYVVITRWGNTADNPVIDTCSMLMTDWVNDMEISWYVLNSLIRSAFSRFVGRKSHSRVIVPFSQIHAQISRYDRHFLPIAVSYRRSVISSLTGWRWRIVTHKYPPSCGKRYTVFNSEPVSVGLFVIFNSTCCFFTDTNTI